MSLFEQTATTLLDRLTKGDISSVELTTAYLDRIAAQDEAIGAFLRVDCDAVLAQAAKIDERRAAGESLGALAGLPVAVKDLICTRGELTTCASKMLENYRPPYDATIVEKLRAADAVLLGKTNMDEFAMGGSNENSAFGPCRNPWDTSRVSGGSSGGAAAAIAARMAPLSIGSDTGGSIRQPAAFCGVTGLKPTYGRVSRYGLVAFASSLDQIGPLAQSAEDTALLLSVLAGHDAHDSTSLDEPVPDYLGELNKPLKGLRLGIIREHFGEGLDAEVDAAVREAIRVYESLGATTVDVSLPHSKYGIATYYIIAPCEASSNLARFDSAHYGHRTDEAELAAELAAERKELQAAGNQQALDNMDNALVRMYRNSRSEGFGAEVKRRIMLGAYALSAGYYDAYYLKAQKVRRLIAGDYEAAFGEVDLIVGPVSPTPAFAVGEKSSDPLAMYLVDLYTVTANLAGVPGISIPCGFTSGNLPVGLQLQGPLLAEAKLLQAAHAYQQQTDWHAKMPNVE